MASSLTVNCSPETVTDDSDHLRLAKEETTRSSESQAVLGPAILAILPHSRPSNSRFDTSKSYAERWEKMVKVDSDDLEPESLVRQRRSSKHQSYSASFMKKTEPERERESYVASTRRKRTRGNSITQDFLIPDDIDLANSDDSYRDDGTESDETDCTINSNERLDSEDDIDLYSS